MTDLSYLKEITAAELLDKLIAQKLFAWQSTVLLDEIRRRLEKCEAEVHAAEVEKGDV